MNEIEFRNWLRKKGTKRKFESDYVSRLKRLEKEFDHCDIDEEYRNDQCKTLLETFDNKGVNKYMAKYKNITLPVGKYQLSTYKHALKKYIVYCMEKDIL